MSEEKAQARMAKTGATIRLPAPMRLAPSEQERLWVGVEGFVNCGDSTTDYEALRQNWRDFWPAKIWYYPNRAPGSTPLVHSITYALAGGRVDEADTKRMEWENQTESLNWHPACHTLFLLYRDTLRQVWRKVRPVRTDAPRTLFDFARVSSPGWTIENAHEFLLGLTDYNEEARQGEVPRKFEYAFPFALFDAWKGIRKQFPNVAVERRLRIRMIWEIGDFTLVPDNDFQKAFYLLFRQSWRARVCPRCKKFFVARKPKQNFCSTGCSAGNRLASKRNWWNHVGAKRRAKQRRAVSKKSRGERKSR